VASVVASALFALTFASSSLAHLRLTRETAANHAATSIEYQHGLSETLARLAVQTRPALAVIAVNPTDYELVFAVLNEVARRSDDRFREYLILDAPPKGSVLLRGMQQVSRRGESEWHTRPVRELAQRAATVCVFLNERPHPVHGCRPGSGVRLVAQGM
jgi:hypothetical protein